MATTCSSISSTATAPAGRTPRSWPNAISTVRSWTDPFGLAPNGPKPVQPPPGFLDMPPDVRRYYQLNQEIKELKNPNIPFYKDRETGKLTKNPICTKANGKQKPNKPADQWDRA